MGLHWPLDKVGNAFQLLGVTVAALGVPVVPPFLARVERALDRAMMAAKRWAENRREAVRAWWARLRGQTRIASLAGTSSGSGSMSGTLTTGRRQLNRDTVGEREWLAFLNDEVDAIWENVRRLDRERAADWAEFERRLATQHEELRAHTLAVTREGWRFIVGGVGCSWFGTLLALVA